MKRALSIIIATIFCLVWLSGCKEQQAETYTATPQEIFCQVHCIKEDGIIVDVFDVNVENYTFDHLKAADGEYVRYVYVKYKNEDLPIDPLDTVVIKFALNQLTPVNGDFVDFFDAEQHYSYVLENPENVRMTNADEPTFG